MTKQYPTMPTKTDLRKAVAYLNDAAKTYEAMPKPKHKWRAKLMRKLAEKIKHELYDEQGAP